MTGTASGFMGPFAVTATSKLSGEITATEQQLGTGWLATGQFDTANKEFASQVQKRIIEPRSGLGLSIQLFPPKATILHRDVNLKGEIRGREIVLKSDVLDLDGVVIDDVQYDGSVELEFKLEFDTRLGARVAWSLAFGVSVIVILALRAAEHRHDLQRLVRGIRAPAGVPPIFVLEPYDVMRLGRPDDDEIL
jgi:hypothetical protein